MCSSKLPCAAPAKARCCNARLSDVPEQQSIQSQSKKGRYTHLFEEICTVKAGSGFSLSILSGGGMRGRREGMFFHLDNAIGPQRPFGLVHTVFSAMGSLSGLIHPRSHRMTAQPTRPGWWPLAKLLRLPIAACNPPNSVGAGMNHGCVPYTQDLRRGCAHRLVCLPFDNYHPSTGAVEAINRFVSEISRSVKPQ